MSCRNRMSCVLAIIVFSMVFVSVSEGTTKYIDDGYAMYFPIPAIPPLIPAQLLYWYDGVSNQISIDLLAMDPGLSKLKDTDGTFYTMTGKCLFTSPLVDDLASSGGIARGNFEGENVTYTIHGTLMLGTDYVLGSATETVDILKGTFDLSQGATWKMQELNATSNTHAGTALFSIDETVGLGLGVTIPNTSDILKAGDFTASLTMEQCSPVDDYTSGVSIYCSSLSKAQFEFVPEPVSLLIFGVGSFLVFSRRRKSSVVSS